MASEPKESPANNPGLQATPDEATKGYIMQQTVSPLNLLLLLLLLFLFFFFF